jgi:hypothetical protein
MDQVGKLLLVRMESYLNDAALAEEQVTFQMNQKNRRMKKMSKDQDTKMEWFRSIAETMEFLLRQQEEERKRQEEEQKQKEQEDNDGEG